MEGHWIRQGDAMWKEENNTMEILISIGKKNSKVRSYEKRKWKGNARLKQEGKHRS